MKDQLNKPMTLIIFGASGDLTHRKLIPALYNLYRKKRLPAEFKIIGFSRSSYTDETFRQELEKSTQEFSQNTYVEETWSHFAAQVEYFQGDLLADEDFENLNNYLLGLGEMGRNRIYYLAISPGMYEKAVVQLGKHRMTGQQGCFKSIVVEKPFGRDLKSAQRLNEILHDSFEEQQVYRIDHYLGKETAQNILFFRFGNTIFEPIWNRRYVSNIQITMAEKIDIAHRAEYYEKSGILRDMFQNHLLQLLTLIAMEPPTSFEADIFRNEKVKVLHAVRPIAFSDVILGQYDGYRSEKKVSPDSSVPTYAALKLFLDNWRWQGVPFYLRSGKALERKTSEVVIEFQLPPHLMFSSGREDEFNSNVLAICIQPDEGIHIEFAAKMPDSNEETKPVMMDFTYQESFGSFAIPDAYERLLLDVIQGDQALFARADEVENQWHIIDPLLERWESMQNPPLCFYPRGSSGPVEADQMLEKDGHQWMLGCGKE